MYVPMYIKYTLAPTFADPSQSLPSPRPSYPPFVVKSAGVSIEQPNEAPGLDQESSEEVRRQASCAG